MKLELKKDSGLLREYEFIITKDEVSKLVDMEAEAAQKKIKMDGFRTGSVPLNIIKDKYLDQLIEKAIVNALDTGVLKMIKDADISMATSPIVDDSKIDFTKISDISAPVKIEINPQVPDIDLSKFTIEKYEVALTDEDIENELKNIANSQSTLKKIEEEKAEAKMGHIVNIDFVGSVDGVPFDGGAAKGHIIELGSKSFIDTFEEQIAGNKAGDKFVVSVKFPDEYHAEALKGKKAEFEVTLNSVFTKETPEINDELAKKIGFETIQTIKDMIRSRSAEIFETAFKTAIKKSALETISSELKFDLPPTLLENEVKRRIADAENDKKDESKPDEVIKLSDSEIKKIKEEVVNMMRLGYLVQEFSSKHKVNVSEKEFEEFVRQDAEYRGISDVSGLLQLYSQNQRAQKGVVALLEENKVFDIMMNEFTCNVKHCNKEEFKDKIEKVNKGEISVVKKKGIFS